MKFDSLLNQARKNASQIQKIAAKIGIDLPNNFSEQIVKLNDCLDTYSSAKTLIATVVHDALSLDGLQDWSNLMSHFDTNWDNFAKEYNEIFNKANANQQKNILETFTREHFGDNIFEAGSLIKNETPQILSGVLEFKNGISSFAGSYRNPVEAAIKIKNGVNAIVRSTEKVAKSMDNIIKFIEQKRGIAKPKGLKLFSNLRNLTSNRGVMHAMAALNVGVSGIQAFSSGSAAFDAFRRGDYKSAKDACKISYKNVKAIVAEIKNIKNKNKARIDDNRLNQSSSQTSNGNSSQNDPSQIQISNEPAYSYICSKAKIRCTNGDKISTLTVLPSRTIWLYGEPQANIGDHLSMVNIAPCGKCHTTHYPPTGSATAANHGRLTPMPCVPNTPFPWMGGKDDVLLQGQPALISTSKVRCVYGGTITITFDGQKI